jgi:nicotinate phosphoribosyltransferase
MDGPDGDAPIKIAGEKTTWPGKKQIARIGEFERDLIRLESEPLPARAHPLLIPVMRHGEPIGAPPSTKEIRERAARSLAALPVELRKLQPARDYPVERSPGLIELQTNAIESLGRHGESRDR